MVNAYKPINEKYNCPRSLGADRVVFPSLQADMGRVKVLMA